MRALLTPRPQRVRTPLGFIVVATLMYVIDGAIAHSALFDTRPELLAAVISVDLTVVVTAAYWWLVVRPGHAAPRTALPVFLLSIGAAALTLPAGHRDFVRDIRYAGAPLELVMIALVLVGVRRARAALAASGMEMDLPERMQLVLARSMPYERLAPVVAMEVSVLYYALASWRRAPFVPTGAQSFSYHRRSSQAAIFYTLALASLVELVAVHLLLRTAAPRLAAALLFLSAFGTFWIIGFARAVQLRPTLVTSDTLHVRQGLRWSIDVPRSEIAGVTYGRVGIPAKGVDGYLRSSFGDANVLIDLHHPCTAHGPYGTTKTVSRVGIAIDELERFRSALS